jgi:peptidylprolyl isomerase domain and WD repeat-containing protein 1
MLEYWVPEEPFDLPKTVKFEYKAETDLYDFKKVRDSEPKIKN